MNTVETEQGEITRIIQQLELTIESLQAAAARLETRLSSVLHGIPVEQPASVSDPTTAVTELGGHLMGMNGTLTGLMNRLQELEGRVAL
jgi:chromosome segregation ATPase